MGHWSGYNRPPLDGLINWGMNRWQDAHDAAADRRIINSTARFQRDHPTSDTYIEVPGFRPIDQPRPRPTREDVRSPSFHGTYTEERHWFWGDDHGNPAS
jgi:hypothetical protein